MELKKNPQFDVNRQRGLYFSIGLMLSFGLVLLAFEYQSPITDQLLQPIETAMDFNDIVEIPPTEQKPPPPAKVIQLPKVVEVSDEVEIEEEIDINLDVEVTEDMIIEEVIFEETPIEEETEEIFLIVENKPVYKGGDAALYKYLSEHLSYPSVARRMGIEGRVYVQFVVWKDGSIRDVVALKGIGGGCDEEAVRVVSNMPKWQPGKQRGKPVNVRMVLPVFFKLSSNQSLTIN